MEFLNLGFFQDLDIGFILPLKETRLFSCFLAEINLLNPVILKKLENSGGIIIIKSQKTEESALFEDLKDSDFAAAYLEEMLAEDDMQGFLIAVRNVAKANGGMQQLAEETSLGRESMYKTLSENGNPKFATLKDILAALGLRFSVVSAQH